MILFVLNWFKKGYIFEANNFWNIRNLKVSNLKSIKTWQKKKTDLTDLNDDILKDVLKKLRFNRKKILDFKNTQVLFALQSEENAQITLWSDALLSLKDL